MRSGASGFPQLAWPVGGGSRFGALRSGPGVPTACVGDGARNHRRAGFGWLVSRGRVYPRVGMHAGAS
eukprot:4500670-Pyramimonas_sp.AAC.1